MVKIHTWHGTTANYETIQYFHVREKCDACGNSRWRVFIFDPAGVVYETIFKCQEFQIEKHVIDFIENGGKTW